MSLTNPTWFSGYDSTDFSRSIRMRYIVCEKHLFDVIPDTHRLPRALAERPGPLELWRSRVPALSPYAYQKASSSVLAFTAAGIQALVTRIQGSREIAEEMLISVWSVSADGKKLSAPLLLHGDLAPKSRDANDHEWIMPRIEFPMPDGCILGEVLGEQHRKLRITEGLLHFE